MKGGSVCRVHGGAARQVRERAARTLVELSYPAAVELGDLMKQKNPSIRLAAANSILDRNGLKGVERSEVDNQVTITVSYEDVATAARIVDVTPQALNGHVNGHQKTAPEGGDERDGED